MDNTHHDGKALEIKVRQGLAAAARGDRDAFSEILADDVDYHLTGSHPFSCHFKGKDQLLDMMDQVRSKFSDAGYVYNVERVIVADDAVVTFFNGIGTMANGKPYHNEYCAVWDFENGKVARIKEYFDSHHVSQMML